MKREGRSNELYITFVNSRLPEFKMDRLYYAGGWENSKRGLSYLELQFVSFSVCKDHIEATYRKTLHNLACAIIKKGHFNKVVMSTIFHFSIFNIDRIC